eukprot:Em0008g542a
MSIWTAVLSSIVLCLRHVFDRWIHGTMFHRVLARILYVPSIAKMSARSRWKPNSAKQWYNRIDETVILGALPFRSQTKELVEKENVRAVISYNEAYELSYFTNSKKEWADHGVEQHWFSTVDFDPPSIPNIWAGLKVIDLHKKRKESVYVHCKAGRGRSAVATVCYLIRANSMDPEKAIEFARSKRPHISINERQRQRILEFHDSLKAEKQD